MRGGLSVVSFWLVRNERRETERDREDREKRMEENREERTGRQKIKLKKITVSVGDVNNRCCECEEEKRGRNLKKR